MYKELLLMANFHLEVELVFNEFDVDKNGMIDKDELKNAARRLTGRSISSKQVNKMMEEINKVLNYTKKTFLL